MPALRRQRQTDEFEADLRPAWSTERFQDSQGYTEEPYLNTNKQNPQNTTVLTPKRLRDIHVKIHHSSYPKETKR